MTAPSKQGARSERQAAVWLRVGRIIARARRAAGLSQPQLARELGVSPGLVPAWEIGGRLPGLALRRRLCDRFGINPRRLLVEQHCPTCGKPWR